MDDLVSLNYTSFFPFYASLTTVIMKNFGRHRQSIVDIEQELRDIFCGHPQCSDNSQGVASLPARCLPDIFDTYQEEYGVELLTKDELATFMQIVDGSPDLEATLDIILQLVAMCTSSSQQIDSKDHSSNPDWDCGRTDEHDQQGQHSRSSSNGGTRSPSKPSGRVAVRPHTPRI